MRAIALLYHDVVIGQDYRSSGFSSADADVYKLDRDVFERHLDAIAGAATRAPGKAADLLAFPSSPVLMLTFDDGGVSAYHVIADLLERRGWRGHFFVSSDYIGRSGFLSVSQIRDLHDRGHSIGSHSASHPQRISHLPASQMVAEWTRSVGTLSEIVGQPVDIASVPGGFYSPAVARAAAQAGVRILFNSEPMMRVRRVGGCWVAGRFGLQQGDSDELAAAFASAAPGPRLARWTYWNAKKVLKSAGGEAWLAFRRRWFARGSD
jgi:peptidoglycan/xylan/chitin deacetylase (PgdA/CDA1 family)